MLGSEQIHQEEHRHWNRDHVRWLEELECWERENQQVQETLRLLDFRLLRHSQLYGRHRLTMLALEQDIHRAARAQNCDTEHLAHLRQRQAEAELVHRRLPFQHSAVLGAVAHLSALLEHQELQ